MKEIIAFSCLIVSVILFAFTYRPEPVVIEKPVIVEKIVKEECKIRDAPDYEKSNDSEDTIDEYEDTLDEVWEEL